MWRVRVESAVIFFKKNFFLQSFGAANRGVFVGGVQGRQPQPQQQQQQQRSLNSPGMTRQNSFPGPEGGFPGPPSPSQAPFVGNGMVGAGNVMGGAPNGMFQAQNPQQQQQMQRIQRQASGPQGAQHLSGE